MSARCSGRHIILFEDPSESHYLLATVFLTILVLTNEKARMCLLGFQESSSQKVRKVSLKDKDGQEVFSGLSQAVVPSDETYNSLNASDAVVVFDEVAASKDSITSRPEVADQVARVVCKHEFVDVTADFSVVANVDVSSDSGASNSAGCPSSLPDGSMPSHLPTASPLPPLRVSDPLAGNPPPPPLCCPNCWKIRSPDDVGEDWFA